jgi:glycosyltransferase involved in cell wall biosynthesis
MLVSIYMPTKNRVESLARAVESVRRQTHREFELWIVDDGSTDSTPEYLRRLSESDSRIHTIRNEQSLGAPRARNLAITQSHGEFVTGLDDDDSFHEQRLEKLLAAWIAFEARGEKFSCLYTQDVLQAGANLDVSHKPARARYEDLFFYNTIGNQVFTKRRFMIDAGLFDEAMPAWQDLDMFMRLLRTSGPALLVNEALYTLEVAQRDDRISVSNVRIEAAYARLAAKVTDHPKVLQQGLFLQRFGRLYGYGLSPRDVRAFWKFGIHPRTLKRLGGIVLRQLSSSVRRKDIAEPTTSSSPQHQPSALRVLMFPKHSDNPYLNTLTQRLEARGAHVDDFTFARALEARYDVLHIHWPDLHLHARSWWRGLAKQARLAFVFAMFRYRGSKVVWTIHNLKPHERHHGVAEFAFPLWFPRLCTHVIAMTASGLAAAHELYPPLKRKAAAIIPHGDYRHAYPAAPSRSKARAQLRLPDRFTFLFFGNIRPYKNVPSLINAFRALPHADVQLLIVGQPQHMDLDELKRLIADDSRIQLRLEFVPDTEVPIYMGAADAVVLPFDSILNSGSVLLALSFNRPVIAPRLGSLPEIQQRVGAQWLNLYDGALSPTHLNCALQRNSIGESTSADLSAFDWNAITQQTLNVYGARLPIAPPQPTQALRAPGASANREQPPTLLRSGRGL